MSDIKLRSYQLEAIKAFESNANKGLLEMATGTGKTFIALASIERNFKREKKQFVVIIVPYLHLIDQWIEDFSLFGIDNYLTVAYGKKYWLPKLKNQIWEYNRGFRDRVVIIGSYRSMGTPEFQNIISTIQEKTFLVADECHYLGSPMYKLNNFFDFEAKLGLSATPRRWWDELGTERIYRLFESTVFEYGMEEAIDGKFLTPYYYYPQLIELTDEELEEYEYYTIKIGVLARNIETKEDQERLEYYLRKRALLLQTAENKKKALLNILKKQKDKRFTLVYCAPGEINEVIQLVSKLGVRVHRFNSEINNRERQRLLTSFEQGEIEVLVAIKCLDEGVDVPATKNAYFLASTSNPREFVQRRGRVLRKSEGKEQANIYDFITLQKGLPFSIFESIARREMPRFAEFSDLSLNKFQERNKVRSVLSGYNLEMYLDIKPWEMYQKMNEKNEGYDGTSSGYH